MTSYPNLKKILYNNKKMNNNKRNEIYKEYSK